MASWRYFPTFINGLDWAHIESEREGLMIGKTETGGTGVGALLKIVEEIHLNYPKLEIGQLMVLLKVIDKPGVRASDLQKELSMSKSTLSLTIRSLGTGAYLDDSRGIEKMGQNLISRVPDPMDNRAKLLAPTALGWSLGDRIDQILRDTYGKTKEKAVAS